MQEGCCLTAPTDVRDVLQECKNQSLDYNYVKWMAAKLLFHCKASVHAHVWSKPQHALHPLQWQ